MSDMLMGPFLNSHYWPMTVCPRIDVALTVGLDVDDSCPSKLQSGKVQILITAEGPGECPVARVLQPTYV
jgi:hypothetical protein